MIGLIGYGWIGWAMHRLFPDAQIYDRYDGIHNDDLTGCDAAFVAVPTPLLDGRLDIREVTYAVQTCPVDLVVIRSALNPGDADRLAQITGKRIVVQPEYLGETPSHPMHDMSTRPFMVLGGEPADRRQVIDIYSTVYNANIYIRQVSCLEAEIIKLSENRAILYKVAQCQELYDACEAAGVDYYTIRDAVYGDDPRMNLWWTFVYPDKRGAHSKCLPKDVEAWAQWAEGVGVDVPATRAMLAYNDSLLGDSHGV